MTRSRCNQPDGGLVQDSPVFWEQSSMAAGAMEDRGIYSLKVSAVKGSKLKKSA